MATAMFGEHTPLLAAERQAKKEGEIGVGCAENHGKEEGRRWDEQSIGLATDWNPQGH